ncbi:MAG: ATP-binding protein [Candidatus Pacearchaeota archaeon]
MGLTDLFKKVKKDQMNDQAKENISANLIDFQQKIEREKEEQLIETKKHYLVKIKIERPNEIYKVVKKGVKNYSRGFNNIETMLLSSALEKPLSSLTISFDSDGKTYSIGSLIEYNSKLEFKEDKIWQSLVKIFNENFNSKKIGDTIYLINEGKIEYEVKYKNEYITKKAVEISNFWPGTESNKITNKTKFFSELENFIQINELVLNNFYKETGTLKTDIELTLFPPKVMPSKVYRKRNNFYGIIVKKPNVKFEEIGGQEIAKKEIQGIVLALSNPLLYKNWGIRKPKGILLYGPPGNGKTLLAKALATEADAKFYNVSVVDVTSMWYGESEKILQDIIDHAKKQKRAIIYFDEFDALGREREDAHEATARIVSVLASNMDGIEETKNVIFIASTNHLNAIDYALLRPGRFDRLIEVKNPTKNERKEIFKIHQEKAKKLAEREIFKQIDLEKISEATEGYSGADIAEIIRRAAEEKIKQESAGLKPDLISTEDILKIISEYERKKKLKPGF